MSQLLQQVRPCLLLTDAIDRFFAYVAEFLRMRHGRHNI